MGTVQSTLSPQPETTRVRPAISTYRPRNGGLTGSNRSSCGPRNESLALSHDRREFQSTVNDREKLSHDVVQLKKSANLAKEENVRLKTRIRQFEDELEKKDKYVGELLAKVEAIEGAASTQKNTRGHPETRLEMALRKQVRTIKLEKAKAEEELRTLKKGVKSTKLKELTAEIKTYADECARLRAKLEEASRKGPDTEDLEAMEGKVYQQNTMIKTLQQENAGLAAAVQQKEIEFGQLRAAVSSLQEKCAKLDHHRKLAVKQKRTIAASSKTILQLKQQLSPIKTDSKDREFCVYQTRIGELLTKQSVLQDQLSQKERRIKLLESKKGSASKQNSVMSVLQQDMEGKKLRDKIAEYEQQIERLTSPNSASMASSAGVDSKRMTRKVSETEMRWPAVELRLSLILAHIPAAEIRERLFRGIEDDERVSVYEFSRVLGRKQLKMREDSAVVLARYLIEPRDDAVTECNDRAERPLAEVLAGIKSAIGEYKVEFNSEELTQAIAQKLGQAARNLAEELTKGKEPKSVFRGDVEDMLKANGRELSAAECDFLTIKAFSATRDIHALRLPDLIGELQKVVAILPEPEVEAEGEEEPEPEQKTPAARTGENEEEKEKKPTPGEPGTEHTQKEEKSAAGETEYQSIDEDQMILIAQKCFFEIAEKLKKRKQTVHSLYKGKLIRTHIDKEDVELLTQLDFINGLQELELEDMQPLQYACLIQVLAINDEEKHIRVSDLVQILEDYGVKDAAGISGPEPVEEIKGKTQEKETEKTPVEAKLEAEAESEPEQTPAPHEAKTEELPVEKPSPELEPEEEAKAQPAEVKEETGELLNFADLDKVSMVLMLALAEYMIKSQTTLQDLFSKAVYNQTGEKDSKTETELLDSKDFFAVLAKIGINIEEREHQNLKKFLCHDSREPDRFSVDKLAAAIEEFGSNDELREVAHKCYEELVSEDLDPAESLGPEDPSIPEKDKYGPPHDRAVGKAETRSSRPVSTLTARRRNRS